MGRGLTACSVQGRDGGWEFWKPERAVLCCAGDGQPKSTGRQQGFPSSWWPGTAQAEILAQGVHLWPPQPGEKIVGVFVFAAMDFVLGSGKGLSCLSPGASVTPWHRL